MYDQDIEKELKVALDCLGEHKVSDVSYLDVAEYTPFASYYVLATCMNPRQLEAMAGHLEEAFEKNKIEVFAKEGIPDSGWVIVQGGDIIVHLFLDVNRKEIDLEGLIVDMAKRSEKNRARK